MTQEEKELLLKDLCARLPYGIMCILSEPPYGEITEPLRMGGLRAFIEDKWNIKPYLRPMSSMTEEEKKEFQAFHCVYELHPDFQSMMCNLANELNMFNWLNAHHFDYRGLIEKGLAIAVTEENNPYEVRGLKNS